MTFKILKPWIWKNATLLSTPISAQRVPILPHLPCRRTSLEEVQVKMKEATQNGLSQLGRFWFFPTQQQARFLKELGVSNAMAVTYPLGWALPGSYVSQFDHQGLEVCAPFALACYGLWFVSQHELSHPCAWTCQSSKMWSLPRKTQLFRQCSDVPCLPTFLKPSVLQKR